MRGIRHSSGESGVVDACMVMNDLGCVGGGAVTGTPRRGGGEGNEEFGLAVDSGSRRGGVVNDWFRKNKTVMTENVLAGLLADLGSVEKSLHQILRWLLPKYCAVIRRPNERLLRKCGDRHAGVCKSPLQ